MIIKVLGNAKDIEPYVDPVFENNVILTETERFWLQTVKDIL